jgi:phosphonate transport system ATP-binding protein
MFMNQALHIRQLNKHFANGKHALRDINLSVQQGEMVALIGASGSGKSTLLRHIAGFVAANAGRIAVLGRTVQDGGESFYFKGDHRVTFPSLYRRVIAGLEGEG